MTATSTFLTPMTSNNGAPAASKASTKPLWKNGAVAGVAASVATTAFAAIAEASGVSLEIGGKAIPVLGFAQLTFVAAIIGTALAVVLSRRASRPRHTFVVTTAVLTALSCVPDVLADAQTSTKAALVLSHVIAAAIVIPALASRLSD